MRYRILIQSRDEEDKHIAHITFETNNINKIIKRITKLLEPEILERMSKLTEYLASRQKGFVKELINETDEDLIDWSSKGKDISKEEFLENELYFAKHY